MSDYKTFTVRGNLRYMKDGKLVKRSSVPQEVIDEHEGVAVAEVPTVAVIVDTEEERRQTDRSCVFCGQYTNWKRLVNQQTIAICEEHYYSETIGSIAQKLRETANATEEVTQKTT